MAPLPRDRTIRRMRMGRQDLSQSMPRQNGVPPPSKVFVYLLPFLSLQYQYPSGH